MNIAHLAFSKTETETKGKAIGKRTGLIANSIRQTQALTAQVLKEEVFVFCQQKEKAIV